MHTLKNFKIPVTWAFTNFIGICLITVTGRPVRTLATGICGPSFPGPLAGKDLHLAGCQPSSLFRLCLSGCWPRLTALSHVTSIYFLEFFTLIPAHFLLLKILLLISNFFKNYSVNFITFRVVQQSSQPNCIAFPSQISDF